MHKQTRLYQEISERCEPVRALIDSGIEAKVLTPRILHTSIRTIERSYDMGFMGFDEAVDRIKLEVYKQYLLAGKKDKYAELVQKYPMAKSSSAE